MTPTSARMRVAIWFGLLIAGTACSDDDSLVVPPSTGSLEVSTSTIGSEPDPDGYTVQLNEQPAQPIGTSASLQLEELEPGSYTVHLAGLAANCAVAENPLTAAVAAGEMAVVRFAVTCSATTGSLEVSSSASGPSQDTDGYVLIVDGSEQGVLGTAATITIPALAPGIHSVGLSGVAANCNVQGDNPRSVDIAAGANTSLIFEVICSEPSAETGTLRVTAATTGTDPDPDGYTIAVDGGPAQPIGVNAAVSLANVAVGEHSVRLAGWSSNCSLEGANPRTATVSAGGITELGFAITCSATSGTVRVDVSTTGSQIDANGYTVKLDGINPGKGVDATGSVTFTAVAAGSHSLTLSDVASNCAVADGNSKGTTVTTGATSVVSFTVSCTATTGTIQVSVTSSGAPPDADGFNVTLDQDGPTRAIPGTGGSESFTDVTVGTHTIVLTGVAPNCSVPDGTSKDVEVAEGATAEVIFAVTCAPAEETWSSIPLPSGFRPISLWANSASYLFVAGSHSGSVSEVAIMHYDGSQWVEQFRGEGIDDLAAFGGTSPADVFAVVGSQTVLEHQGGNWSDVGPENSDLNYASVWPSSSGEIVAGGFVSAIPESGLISHYDGTWTFSSSHGYGAYGIVNDLSGVSPNDVYALGSTSPSSDDPEDQYTEYRVERYDGSSWSLSFSTREGEDLPDGYALNGLWAIASNAVFVVGSKGHIDRFDGAGWSAMESGTSGNLGDVWGNSATNVYAVGNDGTLHYDGANWTVIDTRPARRVWGTEEQVFVLTESAVLYADH